MDYIQSDIVTGLVCRGNNILVMEIRQVLKTFGSFKIDVVPVLIDLLRYLIVISMNNLTDLTHS